MRAQVGNSLPMCSTFLSGAHSALRFKVRTAQILPDALIPCFCVPAPALWSSHFKASASGVVDTQSSLPYRSRCPKPYQSTPPHIICHLLQTQTSIQISAWYFVLETHTTHPSDHNTFRSFQALLISPLSLANLCFIVIYMSNYMSKLKSNDDDVMCYFYSHHNIGVSVM